MVLLPQENKTKNNVNAEVPDFLKLNTSKILLII